MNFKFTETPRTNNFVVQTVGTGQKLRTTNVEQLAAMVKSLRAAIDEDELISAQSVIPLYMTKSSICVASMLAAWLGGRAFANLSPKLKSEHLSANLAAVGCTTCLCDAPQLFQILRLVRDNEELRTIKWRLVGDSLDENSLGQLGKIREYGADIQPIPLLINAHTETWLADRLHELEESRDQLGCVLYTSGSTGTPKAVGIGRNDLIQRGRAEAEAFGLLATDRLLGVLPLSFDVGLSQLFSALCAGASITFTESWLPADLCNMIKSDKITGISAVPAIWQNMLKSNLLSELNSTALRYITVSGGSLSSFDFDRLVKQLNRIGVYKTYGQTECFRTTILKPEDCRAHAESVGQAFSGVEVFVLDESGAECPANEVGEVVHAGLGTMEGYLGSEASGKLRENPLYPYRSSFPKAIFTGDFGSLDSQGFLVLKGRRDHMLKIQGNRVYPMEVSNVIAKIDGVEANVVVGCSSDDETKLVAFVLVAREICSASLRREMVKLLPSYMVPTNVFIVQEIPLTVSGKPDIPRLLQEHACVASDG